MRHSSIRRLAMLIPALALCASALAAQTGAVTSDVPETVDPSADYLIYLHGRIIEVEGRRPTHPAFGVYEYDEILNDFAQRGFRVRRDDHAHWSRPLDP